MRRLSRFDVQRAAYEGIVVFIVMTVTLAVATHLTSKVLATAGLTSVVLFLCGLGSRVIKQGYKVATESHPSISSYQPAFWVAVKTARRMEKAGLQEVRIFTPSGTEVPRSEWKVSWW